MASSLAIGRARSDIDVMSRAGLPLDRFMAEAATALQRVVPFVAACLNTHDPATSLLSGVVKMGDLAGRNDQDAAWAQTEYGRDDPTAITALLASGRVSLGVHEVMGDVERSVRMSELIIPFFAFRDEARVVFTDRAGAWGSVSMFRGDDDAAFSPDDVEFLATVAPSFTRGIRTGLLAQTGRSAVSRSGGPAVLIFDARDRIVQSSPGALEQVARLSASPGNSDPLTMVQGLVTGARRLAEGTIERMPRIRSRTYDGAWLVLHAAPLGGSGERSGDVVVTVEEARPREVVDLVAGVFGLTARERDVVAVLLRGADTKEIATALNLSPYTVQDHLKSIFEKAGVTSRRELVARVFFDQYAPRLGGEVGHSGWFSET